MNGSHWHRCQLALRPGQLLVAAEQYVAEGRTPIGNSVAALPIRLPDDPVRATTLAEVVEASWGDTPTDVIATPHRVTLTAGPAVVVLRGHGLGAWGFARSFRGRLAWVAPSPADDHEGEFLVRVDLARTSRPPRHRTLVLSLDAGMTGVAIPAVGDLVRGTHYANGHVAVAGPGGPDAPWLAGRLTAPPDTMPLARPSRRQGSDPSARR